MAEVGTRGWEGGGSGVGAVLGEIPAASAGMTKWGRGGGGVGGVGVAEVGAWVWRKWGRGGGGVGGAGWRKWGCGGMAEVGARVWQGRGARGVMGGWWDAALVLCSARYPRQARV